MNPRKIFSGFTACLIAVLLSGPAIADRRIQEGNGLIEAVKLQKAKKFDVMTATVEVPPDIDQSRSLEYSCTLTAEIVSLNDIVGIKKVKAKWETHAYVVDHRSGSFEIFDIGEGVFKTNEGGLASAVIPVPADVASAILTESLAAGDVSALIVTEAKLTKGKRINVPNLRCFLDERER